MADLESNAICSLIFNKKVYMVKGFWLEPTPMPGFLERQEESKSSILETPQKQDHEGQMPGSYRQKRKLVEFPRAIFTAGEIHPPKNFILCLTEFIYICVHVGIYIYTHAHVYIYIHARTYI